MFQLPPVDTNRGEILLSLSYLPNAERINIAILKARNLRTSIITNPSWTGTSESMLTAEERPPPACPSSVDKTGEDDI